MNKAKDLLLTLLPSASSIVRRAAAEGLALLATLGVTEDAHFLQSSLLHSLDEVMQGNKLEGKVRILSLDPVSAAKSGSLLTLACIQRTSSNVAQRKRAKARGRVWGSKTDEAVDKSNENLPVLQMMTRILPTSSCHGFKDFFAVKTYALHSFAVLLTYSSRLDTTPLNEEDKQLLRKGVELVEDNFSSAWTAVTVDLDKGPDIEKLSFEVAFVSVIVRLMTYLLPYLHHLQTEDCDAARRFSVLATIILEIYSSLPVVAVECLAFFEVLVYNLPLLSSPAQHVLFSENAMFTCIPRVFAILSPARPMVCLRTFWQSGYQIDSRKTLRAATFLAELMPRPKRFTSQWNDLLLASVLIASFEAVCGSSQFSGGGLLRDVTANREVDTVLHDESALERQLVLAIFSVLLKRSSDHNISFQCTRWILFSRHLLARFVSAESSPSPYSKDNVISQAVSTAEMDCFRVYNTGNPIRWQTKCISAQIAAESLRQLYENERRHDPGIKRSSYFNMSTAIKVIVKECSLASEKAMELPSSRLIFHLEDVLSAVCISSVATSDHAELCTLQENSMHVLARLIDYFGSVDDPEDLSSSILNQFSTQIFSSVKHALSSQPTAAPHSFVTGCLALFSIIENGVTRDPAVLIRLLRPLVLSDESLILLPWSTDTLHQCMMFPEERVVPIHVRVGSVWISSLFMSRDDDYMQKVAKDLFKDILGLAVHSAAVAFDGCQLLFAENLSLVGTMSISGELKPARSSGFFYQSESELDVVVKQMLACGWSQCGLGALNIFLNEFSSGNGDKARQHLCDSWIKAFAPLFLVGVHDAGKSMDARKEEFTVDWAGSIDGTLVLIHCLQGMSLLLKSSFVDWFASEYTVELEQTIKILFDVILIPTISKSKDSTKGHRLATLLVTEACSFTLTVADSCAEGFQEIAIGLLLCLLHPLNQVQGDKIQVSDNPATAEVVETCLLSVGSLIRRGHTTESLVDSMLHLVTSQLLRPDGTIPDKVRGAAKSLLRDCLLHSSLNHQDHERIAINLAETGRWEGWVVVATLDDGLAIVNSLPIVQEAIARSGNLKSQVAAIAAVRSVVQQASENVVGLLLFHVGADSIGALYQNGTMKIIDNARPYRINVCADAMKIILAAYASISRNDSDERMASFLQIVFSIFLAVIRFNGLPNHASPEVSGDPALGRISAQAIVHVARTTPESFKKAVSVLNDRDRTLLEFSVRAEISGYVVVAQANEPAKKKLSLQGYKK